MTLGERLPGLHDDPSVQVAEAPAWKMSEETKQAIAAIDANIRGAHLSLRGILVGASS